MSAILRQTVRGGGGRSVRERERGFSAVAHFNLSIWRRVNCMSAAAKLHMNLYELFALKWIDRHDELQSCLPPSTSLLLWLRLWLPPCCLVPGHCSSATPGTSTQQITWSCCDAKLKIQVVNLATCCRSRRPSTAAAAAAAAGHGDGDEAGAAACPISLCLSLSLSFFSLTLFPSFS